MNLFTCLGANRREERGDISLDPYYVTTAPNISPEEVEDSDEIGRKKITTPDSPYLRPIDGSSILEYEISNEPDCQYEQCIDNMAADAKTKASNAICFGQQTQEQAFRLKDATNTLDDKTESNDVIPSMYLTTVDIGIDSSNKLPPDAKRGKTYDHVTSDHFQPEEETENDYETTEKRMNTYLSLYSDLQ